MKDISIYISVGGFIIALLSLVLTRIDKAKKEGRENNLAVIIYQIGEIKDDIKSLSDKFDRYEEEESKKISKAIEIHERIYHGRGQANE